MGKIINNHKGKVEHTAATITTTKIVIIMLNTSHTLQIGFRTKFDDLAYIARPSSGN